MVSAYTVNAPRANWILHKVLIDGGDKIGQDSLAIGYWDKEPRLASRWDQTQTSKGGNPFSRAPTWYVLPSWMEEAVLGAAPVSLEKKNEARKFLSGGKS